MTESAGFHNKISKKAINLAKTGDITAVELIYNTFSTACYSLALRICGDQSTAEDVVHEAFIKVFKKIDSYSEKGSFGGWLKQIVTNESINRIKQNSRLLLVSDIEQSSNESSSLFDQNWLEANLDLDKLIRQLSCTARVVLILHEVEGYTHKEIANLFDKSESFSKVALSRAYTELKKLVTTTNKEQNNALK